METDFTPHLQEAIRRLKETIDLLSPIVIVPTPDGMPSCSDLFGFHPPVIDNRNTPWTSGDPLGMRKFIDSLSTQMALLQSSLDSTISPKEDPLPNVLGYITFVKQLLISPAPIAAVKIMMHSQSVAEDRQLNGVKNKGMGRKGKEKEKAKGNDEGFVDIIAAGGQEWIRIYRPAGPCIFRKELTSSKKPSNLLAEFREQDSYINSDYDSDSDVDETVGPSDRQSPLTNSMIELVDNLLALMESCERPPGASVPRLTLRLARMQEFPAGGHDDDRVPATYKAIRDRGVNLVFGDLEDTPLELPSSIWKDKKLKPARRINLDPTALLGICSDLLHHPLPANEEEAKKRFFRPEDTLVPGREGRQGNEGSGSWRGQSQNSRELVKGILDEIEKPLIEEIRDTLDSLGEEVEFWATQEAVTHIREALGSDVVVGEGLEQRRMRRMLGLEEGDFFEGSRYEGHEGCLKNLKVNILPESPDADTPRQREDMTGFHQSLSAACSQFLSEYYISLDQPDSKEAKILPSFLQHRKLPVAKVAQLSKPFTIVSVGSFARGAAEGMTTLCMGTVVFRDLWTQSRWKPRGWHQSSYELEKADGVEGRGNAALWMLPYRCMGEGKRVKFEQGDYSYPT